MKKITFLIVLFLSIMNVCNAQQVSLYSFSESTDTYTAVNGTDVTAIGDDGYENGIPIGFVFNFSGINYTTFCVSTNGFIKLGGTMGFASYVNILSNTSTLSPLIAAFWDDNNRGTGSIQYLLSGAAPNQTLEIGWNNINIGGDGITSTSAFASFKIVLHETTDVIDIIYGSTLDVAGNLSASIGLNSANSFLSVTPGTVATVSSATANNAISVTTNLLGVKYTFSPPSNCAGLPMPGDTISANETVCDGVPFELSLQNNLGSGISYQWKTSPDGLNNYVNAPGNSTSNTYTAMQSAVTFYQCIVTCVNSGLTFHSNPIMINMNEPSNCYCTPAYITGITYGDLISNVDITSTTLSNNSGVATTGPSYTYYSGQPSYTATLQAGSTYNIVLTVGTFGYQNVAVWIDYNDDGIFDITERVGYTSTQINANGTATFPIVLSCNAPLGIHRMRVRDVYATAGNTIDPCLSYNFGETEDYDITISSSAPCPQPSGITVTNITAFSALIAWISGCGETIWDVHVTTAGGGVPTGTPSASNVTSPYVLSNLNPETDYEIYVRANCQSNGYSDWTGPYFFSTNGLSPVNDECTNPSSLIVGGLFLDNQAIGTNAWATNSNAPLPGCASFNGGDVWYQVVVPASGNLTIETNNDSANGSSLLDTGIAAYSGDCTNLVLLGCDDDTSPDGLFSLLNLTGLNPGAAIYVNVWEYGNDVMGTFRISAYDASLANSSFSASNFTYYPNPVKDILHISNTQNISKIQVINLLGQEMMVKTINESQGQIDISHLSIGTYLVKVTSEDQVRTINIIKE
jgi:hypothetical protein